MEINTQQMEALLQLREQQAQLPGRNNGADQGFETLLNRQLQLDQAAIPGQAAQQVAPGALYSQIMLEASGESEAVDADTAVMQAAFDQASGALDLWDTYARMLGSSTNNTALKDAYSLLEGIDAQLAELRGNQAARNNPAMEEILNDLAVLTATEKFKFNRGDYLQ